jgi:hypothetical protein
MPIEVTQMERQFAFGGRIIPDPTIVGPEATGRYLRYTIQRSIGSKG